MFGFGLPEILIIIAILVFLFGAKRLPAIGSGLGKTVKEMRKIRQEMRTDKEGQKEDQKVDGGPKLEKEIDEIPGVREAKEIKKTVDSVKKITKLTKFLR